MDSIDKEDDVVLKISSSKDEGYVKKVAGAIGWRLREVGFCKLRAIRSDAVNIAIKAIAIVNKRTENINLAFSIDPIFESIQEDNKGSTAIFMTLREVAAVRPPERIEYRVSGKDVDESFSKLAGAISMAIRDGKMVSLKCIGAASVYKAMYSGTLAKGNVYSYGHKMIFVPVWSSIESNQVDEGQVSSIQIDCWGQKDER